MDTASTIFVAEPDPPMCDSIRAIAGLLELRCETFANGQEFLDLFDLRRPGCLVLEIRIPAVNGLQIQEKLRHMGSTLPLIFLTSAASVSVAVHAMRMGAFHFLEKPFHEHDLWSAIQEAIQFDRENRKAAALQDTIDARISMLSEKEIAVLELLATCKNKHVMAEELGVSIRTIEHYRTQLMRKLKINSVVGLLHIALTAKRSSPHFLRDAVLLGHDGNGAGDVPKQFIGHNGYHALQQPQNPVRRRNSK